MLNFLSGVLFIIAAVIFMFKGCPDNKYHYAQIVCLIWAYGLQAWSNILANRKTLKDLYIETLEETITSLRAEAKEKQNYIFKLMEQKQVNK